MVSRELLAAYISIFYMIFEVLDDDSLWSRFRDDIFDERKSTEKIIIVLKATLLGSLIVCATALGGLALITARRAYWAWKGAPQIRQLVNSSTPATSNHSSIAVRMSNTTAVCFPQVGKAIILKGRTYMVSECLCDGVFSSVYLIEDGETRGTYAMKLEKQQGCERPVLKLDISVLQLMAGCRGFTALIDKGRTRHFKFLIMQRVGPNLADLQRRMPDKRFGLSTVYQIAAQTLERIHCLHTRGWLNRDIKASNFAVGIGRDCRQIYMIDFGLSRRFRKSGGVYLGQRGRGPCVGTWPFCPLASNAGLDQMPIHDIEGWFYFIVFIYKGCLPWFKHAPLPRNTFCRDYKLFVRHVGRSQLLDGLPREWRCIFEAITHRNYFELPDYAMYFDLLMQSAERKKINMQAPLDWEKYNNLRQLVGLPPSLDSRCLALTSSVHTSMPPTQSTATTLQFTSTAQQSVTATPAAVEIEVLSSPFPLPMPEPVLLHGDVPDPLKVSPISN